MGICLHFSYDWIQNYILYNSNREHYTYQCKFTKVVDQQQHRSKSDILLRLGFCYAFDRGFRQRLRIELKLNYLLSFRIKLGKFIPKTHFFMWNLSLSIATEGEGKLDWKEHWIEKLYFTVVCESLQHFLTNSPRESKLTKAPAPAQWQTEPGKRESQGS